MVRFLFNEGVWAGRDILRVVITMSIRIGDTRNSGLTLLTPIMIFFTKSLIASLKGWARPCTPTFWGPTRI